MIQVYIPEESLKSNSSLKKVVVTANFYKQNKYNPLEGLSSNFEKKADEKYPIGVTFEDSFFYDTFKNGIFFLDDDPITLEKFFTTVFEKHFLPTHLLKGLPYRLKYKYFLFNRFRLKLMFNIWDKIKYILYGSKNLIEINQNHKVFPQNLTYNPEIKSEEKSGEKINILGVEANKWALTTYSLIHLSLFIFLYYCDIKPDIVKVILKYSFLTVVYVISSLYIYENFLACLLKKISNYYFNKYKEYFFFVTKI